MTDALHENPETLIQKRTIAILGLFFVGIAPSISVITGFAFKAGALAVIVFIVTKIWMFGLPAFWHIYIEKQKFSWSPVKKVGGAWPLFSGLE